MNRDLTTGTAAPVGNPLPANISLPGGAGCDPNLPVVVTPTPGQTVLTVGANGEYQTIAAAVAASSNGDLILVQPGTYTNDFTEIHTQVTIAGAGGMVNMVETEAPPNEKGFFVVDGNVTVDNFVFTGCAISDADGGNGAGIRYQGGALVLNNDGFIDNQNGIMGQAVDGLPVNTETITDCTFDGNGCATGPTAGYTHNIYVGYGVSTLTATSNIFEEANVGHELKSRAETNVITNNIIYDGPTGTASYDIDLPNGGADTVSGNIIEKGPHAENNAMIHFGGEGIPYGGSDLVVTGNTFINDLGPQAAGVLNQTTLNVNITGNQFDHFEGAAIGEGLFTQSGNVDENGNAIASSASATFANGTDVDDFSGDALTHTVTLTTSMGVRGGGGMLTTYVDAGHVTVLGGAGGLDYEEAAGWGGSYIATAAGANDTINAPGGGDVIDSLGNDSIIGGGGNIAVDVEGSATISSGSNCNGYDVDGQASIIGGSGSDTVQVNNTTSSAFITGAEGYLQVTVNAGTAGFNITQGGAAEQMTISGGASQTRIYNGTVNVTTAGGGDGNVITFGAATATLVSDGNDTIHAGSGTETIIVNQSAAIYGGSGALSVFAHGEQGVTSVYGAGGTITLGGDTGDITYFGGQSANTVDDGLSHTTLQGGAGQMTVAGQSDQQVIGGAGGLVFTTQGGADNITTQNGAFDTVTLADASTLVSNGTDVINAGYGNSNITANGAATITGSTGAAFYTLDGNDSLTANGYTRATVGAGAHVTVSSYGSITSVATSATGTLAFHQLGNTDREAATVTGAGASLYSTAAGTLTSVTLAGGGDGASLGAGHESLVSNVAGAHIWTGCGSDTVALYHGGDVVHAGAGALTLGLNDWSDSTVTTVFGGGGQLTMNQGYGNLVFTGGKGADVLGGTFGGETVTAGAGNMTLMGGGSGTVFTAGAGSANVTMGTSGGNVTFGSGATLVNEAGWGSADVYDFNAGHGGGSDTITGFKAGYDSLVFNGVNVVGNTSQNGSTLLTLSDGTHVNLVGTSSVLTSALTVHH
jgi:hypothetical protein